MVTEALYRADHAARGLGITLLEVRPGYACATMTVEERMLNSHGTCHGGFSYALADTCFGYACNSRNHVTVSAGGDITYTAPGQLGDVLTAVAQERYLRGRTGVYDITVTNQKGEVILLLRGRSRRLDGKVVAEL